MRARLGPQQAIVATAHKIARIVYHLLKTGEPYREKSAAEYEAKRREREINQLRRRAQKLGYTLAPVPATSPESQPDGGGERQFLSNCLFGGSRRLRFYCQYIYDINAISGLVL